MAEKFLNFIEKSEVCKSHLFYVGFTRRLMERFTIHHLGKTFPTKYRALLSDEECNAIRHHFFDPPSQTLVDKQMISLRKGGTKINHICERYFYQLMADCRRKDQKWSIKQFLESDDLIRYAVAKIQAFPKIYHPSFGIYKNLRILFRLSPSSAAAKIGNFPYKSARDIVSKYNVNNKVYDFSCGWGVRLTACLSQNIDYYGTDPNTALVNKLVEYSKRFIAVTSSTSKIDIKCQGSEKYIPSWRNKIGLAFSSPPYFDLEEYSLSNNKGQSVKKYPQYQDWLEKYIKITLINIHKYLISNGILILNIKNIGKTKLNDDCLTLADQCGFELVEVISFAPSINGVNRPLGKDNTERMMVFMKRT